MFGHQGLGKLAAMVGCAIGLLALVNAPAAAADEPTMVPMAGVFKRCDFTSDTYHLARGDGPALARSGPAGQRRWSLE